MSNRGGIVGKNKNMDTCCVLIPNFDIHCSGDEHGCLNKHAHFTDHINILPGKRIVKWEYQFCSGCTDCKPEESECFVHKDISKEEAILILKQEYNNLIPKEILDILATL